MPPIALDQFDPDAVRIVQRLRSHNHAAYLVGGCVRDLWLGRRPKDFDVCTSATPNELRRIFRNCRIIGRRFRLAHIFFGQKIIETATFRANPREAEDDAPADAAAPAEPENSDLLIRRDNVFGTAEEDARRRDFTINGLFYDVDTAQVIDHVDGIVDLEARLVRTIGDPDVRFREDPIRILRAVKFAARCDLQIEPNTYRSMLEHSGEMAKSSPARLSEEFFRLLRAGAAKRSVELLVQTGLLKVLLPDLEAFLTTLEIDDQHRLQRGRFWGYLGALDRSTLKRDSPPTNALILATILFPILRDALHPDTNAIADIGQHVLSAIRPTVDKLKASRREGDLARQILLAMRYIFPSSDPSRRRPRLADREFLDDALRLHEIVSDADSVAPELVGRPLLVAGAAAPAHSDDAPELDSLIDGGRRRHRGDGGRGYSPEAHGAGSPPGGHDPSAIHTPAGSGAQHRPYGTDHPAGWAPQSAVRTSIPSLPPAAPTAPTFLGTGSFGGRWSTSE